MLAPPPRTGVRIRRTKAQLAHCCTALPSYCASNRTVPLGHPCRAVECFRAGCLRRRARGVNTHVVAARSCSSVLRTPAPLSLSIGVDQLERRRSVPLARSRRSSDVLTPCGCEKAVSRREASVIVVKRGEAVRCVRRTVAHGGMSNLNY